MRVSLTLEKDIDFILSQGYIRVVGIDEVGRGSWAGPVAVGAYILDSTTSWFEGINDSKQVPLKERELISHNLSTHGHSIHFGSVESINKIGIGKTITNLIREIVELYNAEDTFFIVDGQFSVDFVENSIKVIRGDSTYYSVAAASILAKVARDNLMKSLHLKYPYYGFNTNVGYPTKVHLEGLRLHGPSNIHRMSFKPIGNF